MKKRKAAPRRPLKGVPDRLKAWVKSGPRKRKVAPGPVTLNLKTGVARDGAGRFASKAVQRKAADVGKLKSEFDGQVLPRGIVDRKAPDETPKSEHAKFEMLDYLSNGLVVEIWRVTDKTAVADWRELFRQVQALRRERKAHGRVQISAFVTTKGGDEIPLGKGINLKADTSLHHATARSLIAGIEENSRRYSTDEETTKRPKFYFVKVRIWTNPDNVKAPPPKKRGRKASRGKG